MQTKRVQCPTCGQVLEVHNTNNETLKQFHCPKCNTFLKTKFPPQQEPLEAKTYLGPQRPAANKGKTVLSGSNMGSTQLAGAIEKRNQKVELEANGHLYSLQEGENVVGRKTDTSNANVQIATNDLYMSRKHCKIVVSTLQNGTKKAVLSGYLNKNRIYIDGQPIGKGDEIRLFDGNKIKMGETIVTFKLS